MQADLVLRPDGPDANAGDTGKQGDAMTGFHQMTAADYHADKVADTATLSSSVAKTILQQSAYHGWAKHPKLGGQHTESTPEQIRGTLLHALTLQTGLEQFRVIAADNYRTKVVQTVRDQAIADGKIPVLTREMDEAEAAADAIRQAALAEGFDLLDADANRERVAVWEELTPFGTILCRGMMDWSRFSASDALILDLKTCQDAHPKACAAHVLKYGHDVQWAAYTSAVGSLVPDLAGRVDYAWLFCEIVPPPRRVVLTVARPDGVMQELGRARWKRACETWARCLKSGQWPAYEQSGGVRLEAPAWAVREELGESYGGIS